MKGWGRNMSMMRKRREKFENLRGDGNDKSKN
jgi:hypothetical protein